MYTGKRAKFKMKLFQSEEKDDLILFCGLNHILACRYSTILIMFPGIMYWISLTKDCA